MRLRVLSAALGATCLGLLSSCGSTKMVSTWADPEYTAGKMGKTLVIGVSNNVTRRRQFEDQFAEQLGKKDVEGHTSYKIVPDAANISEETLGPYVVDHGITHVLVTRLVSREKVETYVPPTVSTTYMPSYPSYYHGYYSYYHASYATVVSPGYSYETEYVHLETNVYEVASEKLVWSGLTETEVGSQANSRIAELIQVIMHQMSKNKLL